MKRNTFAILLVLMLGPIAAHGSVLVKGHLASMGLGLGLPHESSPGHSFINAGDFRMLDLAVGLRVAPEWAVDLQVSPFHGYSSYYSEEVVFFSISVGAGVVRCVSLRQNPRALLLHGSLRGSKAWGWVWPPSDYLEASVAAGMTFWAVNPELELGFRREWGESYLEPAPHRDRLFLLLRVGLGGWYEF